MFDSNEFYERLNLMKRRGRRLISNTFIAKAELGSMSEKRDALLLLGHDAIVILKPENGFMRLYYHALSLEAMAEIGELCKPIAAQLPIVVDIVGRGAEIEEQAKALEQNGMKHYAYFSRWNCAKINHTDFEYNAENCFRPAEERDAPRVYELLRNGFDDFTSHLPDMEKISGFIHDKGIYVAQIEDRVVGMVCMERTGHKSKYLYQEIIEDAYRTTGIGIMLLQYVFEQDEEGMIYTSWTDDKNKASNRMHKYFGFARDGLRNIVMICDRDRA